MILLLILQLLRYRTSEREMGKQHINSINNNKSFNRGYSGSDMFNFLYEKGLFFLMRISSSYKISQTISSDDRILTFKIGIHSKEVRVIKVELTDGTIEILLIKLLLLHLFKELYFFRLGVEVNTKSLKVVLK